METQIAIETSEIIKASIEDWQYASPQCLQATFVYSSLDKSLAGEIFITCLLSFYDCCLLQGLEQHFFILLFN